MEKIYYVEEIAENLLESVHIPCGANWPCLPPTEVPAVRTLDAHIPLPLAKPLPYNLALKPVDHTEVMLHSESLL